MKINTKFNIGDEVFYDVSKVGTIVGIELSVKSDKRNRTKIVISYEVEANNVHDQVELDNKGSLREERQILKTF